jgi:hypothetical protein
MRKPGILLVLGLGFIWVNRLPAPISEIATPTPAEIPTPKPKPKPKPKTEPASKQKTTTISPFAGVWRGSSVGQYHCSNGTEGTTEVNTGLIIRISANANTANGYPTLLDGDGRILTWRFQKTATATQGTSNGTHTCKFFLTGPNNASVVTESVYVDGPQSGCVYKFTGTYAKQ